MIRLAMLGALLFPLLAPAALTVENGADNRLKIKEAVSYTHLTLPTILLV